MKRKRTVLLAAFVVAMGLLLGAITTQAATVICENDPEPCAENESVIRIEDLEVTDSMDVTTVYTVLFFDRQAKEVYGDSLVYDFTNEDDATLAREAVEKALNANVPIPEFVSDPATYPNKVRKFYIGAKTVDEGQFAPSILALGSENPEEFGGGWDDCIVCLNGVYPLDPINSHYFAVFYGSSPKLLSPGGEIDERRPAFAWRSVENATYYYLWVEDSEKEIIIGDWYSAEEASCGLSEDGSSKPGEDCYVASVDQQYFLENGSYNWWVLSWNGESNWEWSDPLSFTVAGPVPTTLTVVKAGEGTGTVISDPPGIDCGDTCFADFLEFAILKAIPDEGSEFTEWAGCDFNPKTNECAVSMTEAKTVTATFSDREPRNLTVVLVGDGTGTVTSEPAGIDCRDTCTAPFVSTSVTLKATPDDGSILQGFVGSCYEANFLTSECTVLMTEAKTVGVIFKAPF